MENRTNGIFVSASATFKKVKYLGCGGYGRVHLVRKVGGSDAGKLFAHKETDKVSMASDPSAREKNLVERLVLERVRGLPFTSTLHYAFETETGLNLVLEYVSGGDLYSMWLDCTSFQEGPVKFYMAELVLALEQLHKKNVVHGDIKMENLLIDSAGHIVLADFGLSRMVLKDQPTKLGGTYEYMAPEVVKQSPGQGFVSDWWSVGVVAYELLVGISPFSPEEENRCKEKIFERIVTTEPDFSGELSARAKAFVKSLLVKDPAMRLGARGAADIKAHPFFHGVDWDHVMRKAYQPPVVPTIRHELDVSNFPEEMTSKAMTEPLLAKSGWKGSRMFTRYTYPSPTVTSPGLTSPSQDGSPQPVERRRRTKRGLAERVAQRAKRLKLSATRQHCVTECVRPSPVQEDVVVIENVDISAPLETRFSPLGEAAVADTVLVEGAGV